MSLTDISGRIGRIVQSLMDPEDAHTPVPEDFVLGGQGQLDSVWALQLVVALEKEFAISIDDTDVKPENFQDLSSLTQFVTRKLSGVGEPSV
jgi:acyl carrier protein